MPEDEESTLVNELNTVDNNILANTLENTVTDNTINENTNLENNNVVNENNNTIVDNTAETSNIEENAENNVSGTDNTSIEDTQDNAVALGTGGGEIKNINSDDEQMKEDAESIKNNYEITLPLRGTITSRFGDRDIQPKFHTGIDIARNTGSEIISATNGTVILAEEQESYGKVLKIQNNDLVVLYAHCDELLVNVGDKIAMMQTIAKVGSTGNSTGPHLHFEIVYCGRYVNPEYVLEFKE